jgi:hypothetical protein
MPCCRKHRANADQRACPEDTAHLPTQAWIGRGVGSTLVKACLAGGARREYDTVCLAVWEENESARAF